ncbi:MAG: Bis(5-nucleosyl)-tetraphosphatase [Acidobacteria bacterium]|nr:Bis(5-nucleosyl)-tetraphosphatase [Acidobacteriota bacterium]
MIVEDWKRGVGLESGDQELDSQNLDGSVQRTIVVGDLHGCYDELIDLLVKLDFGLQDRVVAVGDLIVKGPKNREVLDLFISDRRFSSVLGNHDRDLLQLWAGENLKFTKAQQEAARELEFDRGKYFSYLSSLPLSIDLGSHLVVHAGLRPGIPVLQQEADDLLELRTLGRKKRTSRKGIPWYEVYAGEQTVLFGHWPAMEPRNAPHAIGLDTGCVYGNRLTAYMVETDQLVSVPARSIYRKGSRAFTSRPVTAELPAADQRTNPKPLSPGSTKSIHAGRPVL